MNSAMPGTVKATMPCSGAQMRPLESRFARAGPKLLVPLPSRVATSRRNAGVPVRGHRAQVALFGAGGTVPAGPEEPVVPCRPAHRGTDPGIGQGEVGAAGGVPGGLAELLQEVGVAQGLGDHEGHRV